MVTLPPEIHREVRRAMAHRRTRSQKAAVLAIRVFYAVTAVLVVTALVLPAIFAGLRGQPGTFAFAILFIGLAAWLFHAMARER